MKKGTVLLIIGMGIFLGTKAQQRVVAECTITYTVAAADSATDKELSESLKTAGKTIYIKGNEGRADITGAAYTQSTFFDKTNGTVVVLREFGNNKFMTRLDNTQWAAANKKFAGDVFIPASETKTVLGYECKKGMLQLKDGGSFTVYYASNIIASVKELEYEFKDIPGVVLEYEEQDATGKKIRYTATKINLSPVPASKFDIPTSGYRILN